MELDDLTDMVEGKSDRKSVFSGRDEDVPDAGSGSAGKSQRKLAAYGGHLIDEDEQEESDIEEDQESDGEGSDGMYNSEEMEEDMASGEDSEGEGSDGMYNSEEMEGEEGEEEDSYNSDEEDEEQQDSSDVDGSEEEGSGEFDAEGSGESEEVSGDEGDFEEEEGEEEEAVKDLFTYRPAAGEDIYGRSTASTEVAADKPGKYVPPAKRKAALMEVDEVCIFQYALSMGIVVLILYLH